MTITLQHPTDPSKTWQSGLVGRKPRWVMDMLLKDPNLIPVKEKKVSATVSIVDDTSLKWWRWADQDGDSKTRCIVGAKSSKEAMILLNATMRYPVFQTEWDLCWKKIPADEVVLTVGGVYTFDDNLKVWNPRPIINQVFTLAKIH